MKYKSHDEAAKFYLERADITAQLCHLEILTLYNVY